MAQMKYRKKPIVIDAVQFTGDNLDEIRAFAGKNLVGETCMGRKVYDVLIRTHEGMLSAYPGDWIIKGVHGEFYPCVPDIFEETYELAE